jgi:predicted nucleotidyltransferase
MDIERIKQEIKQTTLGLEKKEILAVGLFGSIARGDFDEKSDIDIFVITEKELKLKEQDEL